jgi:curved DNA-binding protein CbpA
MARLSIKGAASVVDHYERLKISRDAPLEVIRAAYRALAAKHHPDRHGQSEGANTDMAALNAAYEVLCDPMARAAYDATLESAPRATIFGEDDLIARSARRGQSRSRAESASDESAFQPDIDWAALIKKAPVNPWLSRQRLIPLGVLLVALMVAATWWWSHQINEQMAAERMLVSSYQAQLKAQAASEPASAPASASVPSTLPPLKPLAPLKPLPHPLDGEPLPLKPEAGLVDALLKP